MQIRNIFTWNILIFVPGEPILRNLNHTDLTTEMSKNKDYKHMVNYRGVKLCEVTCCFKTAETMQTYDL